MRQIIAPVTLLAGLFLAACGGEGGSGDVAGSYLEQMNRIAAAIEGVQDDASADAAATEIAAAVEVLKELQPTVEAMSDEEREQIFTDNESEFDKAEARMDGAMQSLMSKNPALVAKVTEALMNIPSIE